MGKIDQPLEDYLAKNAADRSNYRRSVKIDDSLSAGQTPLRITQVPYIAGKHREIPARLVTGIITERGICHLGFVQDTEGDAIDDLVAEWQHAEMIEDYDATAPLVEIWNRLAAAINEAQRLALSKRRR